VGNNSAFTMALIEVVAGDEKPGGAQISRKAMKGDLVAFSVVRIGIVSERAGDAEKDQQRLAPDAVGQRGRQTGCSKGRKNQRAENHKCGLIFGEAERTVFTKVCI